MTSSVGGCSAGIVTSGLRIARTLTLNPGRSDGVGSAAVDAAACALGDRARAARRRRDTCPARSPTCRRPGRRASTSRDRSWRSRSRAGSSSMRANPTSRRDGRSNADPSTPAWANTTVDVARSPVVAHGDLHPTLVVDQRRVLDLDRRVAEPPAEREVRLHAVPVEQPLAVEEVVRRWRRRCGRRRRDRPRRAGTANGSRPPGSDVADDDRRRARRRPRPRSTTTAARPRRRRPRASRRPNR